MLDSDFILTYRLKNKAGGSILPAPDQMRFDWEINAAVNGFIRDFYEKDYFYSVKRHDFDYESGVGTVVVHPVINTTSALMARDLHPIDTHLLYQESSVVPNFIGDVIAQPILRNYEKPLIFTNYEGGSFYIEKVILFSPYCKTKASKKRLRRGERFNFMMQNDNALPRGVDKDLKQPYRWNLNPNTNYFYHVAVVDLEKNIGYFKKAEPEVEKRYVIPTKENPTEIMCLYNNSFDWALDEGLVELNKPFIAGLTYSFDKWPLVFQNLIEMVIEG